MYSHLTRDDRVVISNCLPLGESYSSIGERLGKDKSAICREIGRNKDADGRYRVFGADQKSRKRRRHSKYGSRKIENDTMLAKRIERLLDPLYSPETIAHKLGLTHETIYGWIYRSRPDLKVKLPRRGKKRRKYGSKREQKQGWTKDVRSIHERLEQDENWEGDTLKGKTRPGLLTHVERESLFTLVDLLPARTADNVHARIVRQSIQGTITYDRGSEFALWRMIEEDTGAWVYFADPHAPWQRPKNENTNGRLRRVFPKGFDFATINQREVDRVVWKMNHTPRKSLSWRTPCEVYGKCCTSR